MKDSFDALTRFERKYVKPAMGRTLIVGSRLYAGKPDRRKLYEDAVGVDMQAGPGVDCVLDLEDPLPYDLGLFDHVECISVIEHSRRPWLMAANIQRLLKPGSTLYVQAPFVWRTHGYPSDYWRYTAEGLRELFPNVEFTRLMYASAGRLSVKSNIPSMDYGGGKVYFARTEICGFGVRK